MSGDFREVSPVVDRLLLEQGGYSPVELLLIEGRLSFADYEAWRCGEFATLEEVLAGNPERIRTLLQQAAEHATALGLRAERQEFPSWGVRAGKALKISRDEALEKLCCTRYARGGNEVQLDLFMDNSGNMRVNEIVAALMARNTDESGRLLDKLLDSDPAHPRLGGLDGLFRALKKLPAPILDPVAENEELEGRLTQWATEELGAGARDFLVPFWRRLACGLRGQPFAAEAPLLHASYPLARALDWAGVRGAVLDERAWQDFPVLRLRLAEAEFRLGNRQAALALWCRMCWDFPGDAEWAFNDHALPDRDWSSEWGRFCDLDVDPPLETAFFPAWLLLERAEVRDALAATCAPQIHSAGRAYAALHDLLKSGGALSEQVMALRQTLKRAHPGLFAIYMRIL